MFNIPRITDIKQERGVPLTKVLPDDGHFLEWVFDGSTAGSDASIWLERTYVRTCCTSLIRLNALVLPNGSISYRSPFSSVYLWQAHVLLFMTQAIARISCMV